MRASRGMVEQSVDCEIVRSKGFVLLASRAELRADGVVLHTEEEVAPGDEVIVSACLRAGGTWVDAVGRVVHVSPRHGRRCRVAIVFVKIDEGDRELVADDDLDSLLSEPPPPPPVLH